MNTITVDEARTMLPGLLAGLPAGDEIVITDGTKPVARLVGVGPTPLPAPRVPGSAVGILTVVSDDDDHLKLFEEASG